MLACSHDQAMGYKVRLMHLATLVVGLSLINVPASGFEFEKLELPPHLQLKESSTYQSGRWTVETLLAASTSDLVPPKDRIYAQIRLGYALLDEDPILAVKHFNSAKNSPSFNPELQLLLELLAIAGEFNAGNYQHVLAQADQKLRQSVDEDSRTFLEELAVKSAYLDRNYYKATQYGGTSNKPRNDEVTLATAESYLKLENYSRAFELFESLLPNYPYSKSSRTALQTLLDHSCSSTSGEGKYVFSQDSLLALTKGKWKFAYISALGQALIDSSIRTKTGTRVLDPLEKADLFFRSQNYGASEYLLTSLIKPMPIDNEPFFEVFSRLAAVYFRMGLYQDSAQYAARALEQNAPEKTRNHLLEVLADSLRYSGDLTEANLIYAVIRPDSIRLPTTWNYFWSMLRSGNIEHANQIFQTKIKKEFRSSLTAAGQKYWEARIQEHLGQQELAAQEFLKISKEHDRSYYSILSKSRFEESVLKSSSSWGSPGFEHYSEQQLSNAQLDAAKSIVSSENMAKFGLNGFAKSLVSKVLPSALEEKGLQRRAVEIASQLEIYKFVQWPYLRYLKLSRDPRSAGNAAQSISDIEKLRFQYPIAYSENVGTVARSADIDPFLILSIMKVESLFEPSAKSGVGAIGLMQLMPFTAYSIARQTNDQHFKFKEIASSGKNIQYGAIYLKRLLEYYQGNVFLVAAAYNAGPLAVNRWINRCGSCSIDVFVEEIPYSETRNYVKKVIENYYNYHALYSGTSLVANPLSTPASPLDSDDLF